MQLASLPLFQNFSLYLTLAAPYLALVACVLALLVLMFCFMLRRRFMRLSLGRSGSLEESITILSRDMKELQTFRSELEKYLKLAEVRLRGSIQGVSIVRFNPFSGDGSGGNQSFAVAFLDERLCGVVLSTLYARDRVGVYAKPIENGTSTYELTAEEKNAVEKATQTIAENRKRTSV